jgi:hypothetical protein
MLRSKLRPLLLSAKKARDARGATQRWLSVLCLVLAILVPCAGQQSSSIRVTVIDGRSALASKAEVRILELPGLVGTPIPNGIFLFSGVPSGVYQISAKHPGFRDKVVAGVAVIEGKTTELTIEMEEAPPQSSDYPVQQELFDPHLYSKPLTEIGQPLLCPGSVSDQTERYRFIWVPTFYRPIFLRIDIGPDGTATLLSYVWSGAGGYEWGKPARRLRKLTADEQTELFATLADIGFWSLPARVEDPPNLVVLDGTEWLIEGVRDGRCHVVTRYSTPLTELFENQFLAKVAKLKPYDASRR